MLYNKKYNEIATDRENREIVAGNDGE